MLVSEAAKRKAVEVMFVGWVAERTVVRVVGRFDPNAPAGSNETVEFFHGSDDVGQMLNDMNGAQTVE